MSIFSRIFSKNRSPEGENAPDEAAAKRSEQADVAPSLPATNEVARKASPPAARAPAPQAPRVAQTNVAGKQANAAGTQASAAGAQTSVNGAVPQPARPAVVAPRGVANTVMGMGAVTPPQQQATRAVAPAMPASAPKPQPSAFVGLSSGVQHSPFATTSSLGRVAPSIADRAAPPPVDRGATAYAETTPKAAVEQSARPIAERPVVAPLERPFVAAPERATAASPDRTAAVPPDRPAPASLDRAAPVSTERLVPALPERARVALSDRAPPLKSQPPLPPIAPTQPSLGVSRPEAPNFGSTSKLASNDTSGSGVGLATMPLRAFDASRPLGTGGAPPTERGVGFSHVAPAGRTQEAQEPAAPNDPPAALAKAPVASPSQPSATRHSTPPMGFTVGAVPLRNEELTPPIGGVFVRNERPAPGNAVARPEAPGVAIARPEAPGIPLAVPSAVATARTPVNVVEPASAIATTGLATERVRANADLGLERSLPNAARPLDEVSRLSLDFASLELPSPALADAPPALAPPALGAPKSAPPRVPSDVPRRDDRRARHALRQPRRIR